MLARAIAKEVAREIQSTTYYCLKIETWGGNWSINPVFKKKVVVFKRCYKCVLCSFNSLDIQAKQFDNFGIFIFLTLLGLGLIKISNVSANFNNPKARFARVGIFFTLRLFAWESFIDKKVGIRINYGPQVDKSKSFYNKSGLSFFDFQLFY